MLPVWARLPMAKGSDLRTSHQAVVIAINPAKIGSDVVKAGVKRLAARDTVIGVTRVTMESRVTVHIVGAVCGRRMHFVDGRLLGWVVLVRENTASHTKTTCKQRQANGQFADERAHDVAPGIKGIASVASFRFKQGRVNPCEERNGQSIVQADRRNYCLRTFTPAALF